MSEERKIRLLVTTVLPGMAEHSIGVECSISCAHQLNLPYDSPCNRLHGHNYTVRTVVAAPELNEYGMVADYSLLKSVIREYDHRNLNDMFPQGMATTAENFAKLLYDRISLMLATTPGVAPRARVLFVEVRETSGTISSFMALGDGENPYWKDEDSEG